MVQSAAGTLDHPLRPAARSLDGWSRRWLDRLSGLRLGTLACAIVIGAVFIAFVAMTVLASAALRAGEQRQAEEQLDWAMRVAALALADTIPGAVMNWSADGAAQSLTLPRFPAASDQYALDWVGAAINGRVAVMRFDPRSGDFVGRLMSLAGEPGSVAPLRLHATDGDAEPVPADAQGAAPRAGHILLRDDDGRVAGMLFVTMDEERWLGDDLTQLSGLVVGLFLLVSGGACLLLLRVSAPVPALASALQRVSAGDFTPSSPGRPLGREARTIAEAVEIFRRRSTGILALGERVAALQVHCRAQETTNHALASDFDKALAAAIEGDFSRPMPDAASGPFAGLPRRLNTLFDTCRRSLGATGAVLDGLAGSDLSVRATGDFGGAFGSLQRDANAVADRMAALIAQLRGKAYGVRSAVEEAAFALDRAGEGIDVGAEAIARAGIAIERCREHAVSMDDVLASFSFARAPVGAPPRPDAYRVYTQYSQSFGETTAPRLAVVGGKDWAH